MTATMTLLKTAAEAAAPPGTEWFLVVVGNVETSPGSIWFYGRNIHWSIRHTQHFFTKDGAAGQRPRDLPKSLMPSLERWHGTRALGAPSDILLPTKEVAGYQRYHLTW